MKDCTTCKYGHEDERLGIPMCHHPKRFSEDCIDFNMHEEKEIKESEKLMNQKGLDVTDFCKPIDPGIAQCIADHSWEMLGEDEKPVPADLEEAADNHIGEVVDAAGHPGWEWETRDVKDDFIAGYNLCKEQMLKEAVETEVTETCGISSVWIKTKQFKPGQKVRIIIVKEDSHE